MNNLSYYAGKIKALTKTRKKMNLDVVMVERTSSRSRLENSSRTMKSAMTDICFQKRSSTRLERRRSSLKHPYFTVKLTSSSITRTFGPISSATNPIEYTTVCTKMTSGCL